MTIADSLAGLLAQDAGAPPQTPFGSLLESPIPLFIGLFFLFYFIVLLPERRRKAAEAKMMSTLKKNDRVITIGGIHATVVAAPPDAKVVTIRIEDNTRMKVNRSAIASIVSDKETQEASGKEAASDTKDS